MTKLAKETNVETEKMNALAKCLGVSPEDIMPVNGYFEHGGGDYSVYTDDEAGQAATDYIMESLWAFNASYIVDCMPDKPDGRTRAKIEEAIKAMQEKLCEDANCLIQAIVGDNIDYFIEHAIDVDGRGHFLSQYDGKEMEEDGFYIYRTN